MRGTTRDMSDAHEKHLVEVLGGRMTRGSGNQPANPMDGRHNHREEDVAFCWDGKSTLGKSIGVSREMWDKAVEQSHGERPCLPLRFYFNERLTDALDLVVLRLDDLAELLDRSRRLSEYERDGKGIARCSCGRYFDMNQHPAGSHVVHSDDGTHHVVIS